MQFASKILTPRGMHYNGFQEIGIATLWEDLDIKLFTPGFLGFLGIKQFKIAIGKIGGIKIESAGGRNKFIC